MLLGIPMNDLIIYGGAGAFVLVVFLMLSGGKSAKQKKRVEKLKSRKSGKAKTTEEMLSLRRKGEEPTSKFITTLMSPLPDMERLGARLQRAGLKISPRQYALRCIIALLVITFATKLFGKSIIIGFCVGILLAIWMPLKVIGFRIDKQKKKFLQIFPDGIDLIVRGLRSGLPVSESIVLVSHEVPDPVASAFQHVSNTMKLGVPMEKALAEVARKLDYTEFNFFVTSITLQRETGGNLSEILNNLSEVLRKRYMMKMKIKAMTSEARASAIIIGSLPFFVSGAVSVMSPGYMNILYTDYRGNIAALTAAGMLTLGIWTMRRMARFEI